MKSNGSIPPLNEREEGIRARLLKRVEELSEAHGQEYSFLGHVWWNHNHTAGTRMVKYRNDDGTSTVFMLTSRWDRDFKKIIDDPRMGQFTDNAIEYWTMQMEDRSNALVVDGKHYRVNRDEHEAQSDLAGHGGRKFVFRIWDDELAARLKDAGLQIENHGAQGYILTTKNVWSQGVIPPMFRKRMPDNAEPL